MKIHIMRAICQIARRTTLLALATTIVAVSAYELALARPDELRCTFQTIAVPCAKLPTPRVIGLNRVKIRYKPVRAIPIWPSNDILGGSDDSSYESRNAAYYNRLDSRKALRDITQLDPRSYEFGKGFVDSFFSVPEYRELLAVDDVYLGRQVFQLWLQAVAKGVICGDTEPDNDDNDDGAVRFCAFVRQRVSTARRMILEYCTFDETSQEIRGYVYCVDVARDALGTKSILASRYTYFGGDLGYGGGEGHYECDMADLNPDDITDRFVGFIKTQVGLAAKISTAADHHYPRTTRVAAEVLNLRDPAENVFLRARLDAGVGPLRDANDQAIPGAGFDLSTNFTISVQSSDNIIDYREPNTSMGNRIRSRLQDRLKQFAKQLSPTAHCQAIGE
jgi:hypothetical protein